MIKRLFNRLFAKRQEAKMMEQYVATISEECNVMYPERTSPR